FVVIEERTAGVPTLFAIAWVGSDASLLSDVGERAVPLVTPQHAVTPVGDKQILPTVVVIISGANALPPTSVRDASFLGHIGKRAVAVVFIKAADWCLPRRPLRFEARPVDEKNV